MEAISVVVNVQGEKVTFVEPPLKEVPKIVASLRKVIKDVKFGEDVDGLDMMMDIMSKDETVDVIIAVLTAMCDKDTSFFDNINLSDATAIYDGFKDSDFEKVIRRFFTKATGTQQTVKG